MKKKTWDLYAPIYKRAIKAGQKIYDYMDTQEVIRDKAVLELAAGPGLLARHAVHSKKWPPGPL